MENLDQFYVSTICWKNKHCNQDLPLADNNDIFFDVG